MAMKVLKRALSLFIVGLFVFTAFAVIQSAGGQEQASPSAVNSFTFPYQYGTPTVPSDIGAQGIQGPTVPSSDIGAYGSPGNNGHVGILGESNSWVLSNIPVSFSLHVYNGTPTSFSPAINQKVAFQNTTTGQYVSGKTSSSGWFNITLSNGFWSLRVNASSSTNDNFRSYSTFHVSSSFDTFTVYLIPSSTGSVAVNNGGSDILWVNSILPQMTVELLNESSSGAILATAQTMSNASLSFTGVNPSYSYELESMGYRNSVSGINEYMGNITTSSFTLTSTVTSYPLDNYPLRRDGINSGTATISGFTPPKYGCWSASSNITISNGTIFIGGPISDAGKTIKFENDRIYLNTSEFTFVDEKFIIDNSTLFSIYPSFNVEGYGQSIDRGSTTDNFFINNSVIYLPFVNGGYPRMTSVLGPSISNTAIVDSPFIEGSAITGAKNTIYTNDIIENSSLYQNVNLTYDRIMNSNIGGDIIGENGVYFAGNHTVYDNYFVNSSYTDIQGSSGENVNLTFFDNIIINPNTISVGVFVESNTPMPGTSNFSHNTILFNHTYPNTFVLNRALVFNGASFSENFINTTAILIDNQSFHIEFEPLKGLSELVTNNIIEEKYDAQDLLQYDKSPNADLMTSYIIDENYVIFSNNYFYLFAPLFAYNGFQGWFNLNGNTTYNHNMFIAADLQLYIGCSPSGEYPMYVNLYNNTFTGACMNESIIYNLFGKIIPSSYVLMVATHNDTYLTVNTTDNSFDMFLSGQGLPTVASDGPYSGYFNFTNNLFTNQGISGPTPGKYWNPPFTTDILATGYTHVRIVGNYFLNLNNMTNPWMNQGDHYPVYTSGNHYYVSAPPLDSYNKAGYVAVYSNSELSNRSKVSIENLTYTILVNSSASTSDYNYVYNTSLQRSSLNDFHMNFYVYVFTPDVSIQSGTPTISYSNGLVGGHQPNFIWKGYNYSESVEPTYIQVGVNSSKAPSIGLQFQGIAGALYDIEMFNNGSLISSYQESATSSGVLNATYNPATMPLDPIFYVEYVGSGVVPPPVVTPLVPIVPHVLFGIPYLNVIVLFGGIALASEEFFRTQAKGKEKKYSYTGIFVGIMIAGIGLMSVL